MMLLIPIAALLAALLLTLNPRRFVGARTWITRSAAIATLPNAARTEWRAKKIGFNPIANVSMALIGANFVRGRAVATKRKFDDVSPKSHNSCFTNKSAIMNFLFTAKIKRVVVFGSMLLFFCEPNEAFADQHRTDPNVFIDRFERLCIQPRLDIQKTQDAHRQLSGNEFPLKPKRDEIDGLDYYFSMLKQDKKLIVFNARAEPGSSRFVYCDVSSIFDPWKIALETIVKHFGLKRVGSAISEGPFTTGALTIRWTSDIYPQFAFEAQIGSPNEPLFAGIVLIARSLDTQ